ncbi:MAG: hypothetical protein ABWZ40_09235 [Caulobacterales bacterium]
MAVSAAAVWAATASASFAEPSLHGFADISVKTDYITPRGLHVVDDGATIQYLNGLVLAFDKVSLVGGIWTDFNPGYNKSENSEAFNEFDWFVGADYKVTDKLKVGVQYVEFISPQNAFDTEKNVEFSVNYSDSLKPISINPYAKLFWAIDGDSTVVLGKKGDTFDVEIGAVPTYQFEGGFPLTVSAPTCNTVGPEEYRGGDENVGVFSTGLKLSHPLSFMPKGAGNWSVYGGYQHYFFINDNLKTARTILTGQTGKDDGIWSLGLSMGF